MRYSRESKENSESRRGDPKAPFEPAIWNRAKKLAAEYRLILEADGRGGYIGSSVEFPGVLAEGRTVEECVSSVQKALTFAAATMIASGRRPPAPARRGLREAQINVRLTSDEKFTLEDFARRVGFKGISDFVRTAALERATLA